MKLYKVLKNGKSFHGGSMAWSLPAKGKPGRWHAVDGPVDICRTGLHLTHYPETWWQPGCQVYEAEAQAVVGTEAETKVAARRVRLIRQVSWIDYARDRGVRVLRCTNGYVGAEVCDA